MNTYLIYGIILVILLILELLYFTIADKFDIIDKPNERSSHSSIVRRGGGIIFLLGAWIWSIVFGFQYPFFLAAVTLAAGISFIDDIHSLPDSARLIVQFAAMGLLVWQLFIMAGNNSFIQTSDLWIKIGFIAMALVVCVGATNIYNFMDGINGITACYSAAVLLPLLLVNRTYNFVDTSFLLIILLAVIVFSFFNFRPRGKAFRYKDVTIQMDTTYWGRGFGLMVIRDAVRGKVLWHKYVHHETIAQYVEGVDWLKDNGFRIYGAVIDEIKGLPLALKPVPVQMC